MRHNRYLLPLRGEVLFIYLIVCCPPLSRTPFYITHHTSHRYSDDSEREEENEKQDTLGSASGPIVSRVPFGNADSQPRGDRGDSNSEGGNGNKSKRVSFLPVGKSQLIPTRILIICDLTSFCSGVYIK